MENIYNTPAETIDGNIKAGVTKANLNIWKMIFMGVMAGGFIAFGGEASNVAAHAITNVGLARVVAGLIFPVGLMMIVLVGGELFTGNCLLIMDIMDKKVTVAQVLRNLVVVYFSNMLGAFIVTALTFWSRQFNYSSGLLGAYTIKVAVGKCSLDFFPAFCSGILCNILVCIAILMAGTAKDIIGKLFAILFPILAFVISGFEHCVANMFYIPAGILAATNPDYVRMAEEAYGLTADQIHSALSFSGYLSNLGPVTLGNIIGGMVCVGIVFYEINKSKFCNPPKEENK
ncbi:MAG: formate/nitrite transporter family protein [Clostridium sp.]|nr:formate/nitrite transporter family protein [Clostridium sp.]